MRDALQVLTDAVDMLSAGRGQCRDVLKKVVRSLCQLRSEQICPDGRERFGRVLDALGYDRRLPVRAGSERLIEAENSVDDLSEVECIRLIHEIICLQNAQEHFLAEAS